jgi:hypothetical protein
MNLSRSILFDEYDSAENMIVYLKGLIQNGTNLRKIFEI